MHALVNNGVIITSHTSLRADNEKINNILTNKYISPVLFITNGYL